MDATVVEAIEELMPSVTARQRDVERAVVDQVTRGEVVVLLRWPDGTEQPLDKDGLRGLIAMLTARASGQTVSVVAHGALISPQKAAGLLGVSRPMVYRLIERGDLEAARVGAHWRVRTSDVLKLARERDRLARQIDAGFAVALEAGGATGRQVDAKSTWRSATEQERADALALVHEVDDDRVGR